MATRTHPDEWLDTDPAMLATVLEVLNDRAKQASKR